MTTRFVLAGNSSWLNRGCEAIERSVQSILAEVIPDARIAALPFGVGDPREAALGVADRLSPPNWSLDRGSPEWFRRNLYKRFHMGAPRHAYATAYDPLRELLRGDTCLVQVGGDNFTLDYGRPDAFFALNDIARAARRPVVLWGATVGPFSEDPAFERYAARQLKRADLVLVRERLSVEYLGSIGVSENVRVVMDPAFVLDAVQPDQDLSAILCDLPVALNVSPLFARYGHLSQAEFIDEVRTLIRTVVADLNCPVLLVPHVLLPGQDDAQFNEEVCESLSDLGAMLRVLPRTLGAREIKWCVARCRAVVAARTHLTIAGFSTGTPTLSLGYSMKARGINLEVYGHDRYVIDVADFGAETVATALVALLKDEVAVRQQLADNRDAFKSSALSAGQELLQLPVFAGMKS